MRPVTKWDNYVLSVCILHLKTVRTTSGTETDTDEVSIQNSFEESEEKEVNTITPTFSEGNEKIDEYEVKKYYSSTEVTPQRKARTVDSGVIYGMVCLSCFANPAKGSWNCYSGHSVPTKKCADAEQCYTELNPSYIRRGCILPGRVNRTFICKCPLCNDKPSFDISHYEYKHVNDWEYDNARLQAPLIGLDLMCKVCETKGSNPTSDKNCRSGKNADYMVCAHNQLCYTNVDDEIDFVSRGCIDKPLFNSMFIFCNTAKCNTQPFPNPREKTRLRSQAVQLKYDGSSRKIRKVKTNLGSKAYFNDLCSIFMIVLTLIQYI
ncbi:hypothetical protein PYW08_003166 [Mythimna loreyi]|uniref:Uncharacterized protein n=1 Tax=Mythimna loreyi TaxID=667449 RepID=A0ACC2QSD1_9NEOP|nr:hypothetical protein PYW08_003166 [Mythimna loreyi]